MERILTPDEKIRRAEENYYRKRIQANRYDMARVSVSTKKNYKPLKKMLIQIAVCVLLYAVLYIMQATNYVFSGDIIGKTKEILSYDMDFQNLYNTAVEYFSNFVPKQEESVEPAVEENEIQENEVTQENVAKPEEEQNEVPENVTAKPEEGTGGAEVEKPEENLTQMEKDAKEIKEKYSIKSPLKGTITSRFGNRTPTDPDIPKYHTGIDIGVNEGTVFVASMEGTVELVSSEGPYREPCKDSKRRCNNFVCTLQKDICRKRSKNKAGAKNRGNRSNRKCNRSTFTF